MAENGTLGDRLRRKRREHSITQEELAHLSGVSQVMIAKIEQGRRQPRLPVLRRLSNALDISLSELLDNRPRLDGRRDGASILAIRDALLSPSQLPGIDVSSDDAEPTALPQLRAVVAEAANRYWAGDFAPLAAMLPALIGEARLTTQSVGPKRAACSPRPTTSPPPLWCTWARKTSPPWPLSTPLLPLWPATMSSCTPRSKGLRVGASASGAPG